MEPLRQSLLHGETSHLKSLGGGRNLPKCSCEALPTSCPLISYIFAYTGLRLCMGDVIPDFQMFYRKVTGA